MHVPSKGIMASLKGRWFDLLTKQRRHQAAPVTLEAGSSTGCQPDTMYELAAILHLHGLLTTFKTELSGYLLGGEVSVNTALGRHAHSRGMPLGLCSA